MAAVNFLHDLPPRMREIWRWVVAVDAWDFADSAPLAELLRTEASVPFEVQSVLAGIVEGSRKSNKKAAAKLKVLACDRMEVAAGVSINLGLIDVLKRGSNDGRRILEFWADQRQREPIDELREMRQAAREVVADTARDMGVSVETIENLLRDLRKKIEMFPLM